MKRKQWIAICLVTALLISGMPMTAFAGEVLQKGTIETDLIEWASYTGGMTLEDRSKISMYADTVEADYAGAKAALIKGIMNRESEINIMDYNIPIGDVRLLYSEVCYENPHLFYIETGCSYSYGGDYLYSIFPRYNGDFTEEDVVIYENRIQEIMDTIPMGMSEEETALALHDYLVSHCAYDTDFQNYDAYSALVWGDTVCQGYALAYSDLLNRYGVTNKYVASLAMDHAWNLVQIDGEWYHVDATWDDPLYGGEDLLGYVGHANFLRSDSGITAQEHYSWSTDITCDSSRFEEGSEWSGVTSAFVFEGSQEYYFIRSGLLLKRDGNELITVSNSTSDRWMVWEGSGYWSGTYNGLVKIGNVLYYNNRDTIYSYDLDTELEIQYYIYDGSKGYLYGLAESVDGSVLQAEVRTSPNEGEVDIVTISPMETPDYEGAKKALLEGFLKMEEFVSVSEYNITIEMLNVIFREVFYENPQFFYLQPTFAASGSGDYISYVMLSYYEQYSLDDVQTYENHIKEIMDVIPSGMNERDTALALHDYLATHSVYDTEGKKRDPFSALVLGSAASEGYALAYSDLLNRYGIENEYVSSLFMQHDWNLVQIDGEWYHVDVALDDSLNGGEDLFGYVGHDNFLRSDKGITETGHELWDANIACDSKLYDSYYWTGNTSAFIFVDTSTSYFMERGKLFVRENGTVIEISDSAMNSWPVWEESGYWSDFFNSLVKIDNVLYYNDAYTIYVYDLDSQEEMKYYTYDASKGYIYGLAKSLDGKTIQVEIRTSPDKGEVDVITIPNMSETKVQITSQPTDQTAEENEYVTFSVKADGIELKYQWQFTKDGVYWSNSSMAGSNTANMKVQALASRDGYQYRCVVTDIEGNEAVSEPAKLIVDTFTIVKQPESQVVNENENITFSVEVKGTGLKYQWQFTKDGVYWSNSSMTGSNTANMKVQALASRNGYQYRCVVTNAKGVELISQPAKLTINVFEITQQPMSQTVDENQYTSFTVQAKGTGLKYQWQFSKDGAYWSDSSMAGSTTASMKVQALASRDGYQYRCVITDANGNKLISDIAKLTVSSLSIINHPTSQNAKENAYVTFEVKAEGNGLKYQWQCCKDGSYWFDSSMEGSNTSSLRVQALTNRDGYQYRCVVTDANGKSIVSNPAKLTIAGITINAHPTNQATTENAYVTFVVEAEGTGLKYQWQCCKDGVYWFDSSMAGANTSTLRVQALESRDGYQYRCVITDANGTKAISNAATLVLIDMVIISQPTSQTVSKNAMVTFVVKAEGTGLKYQWQCCKDGTYWFDSSMAGANTSTLQVQALESRDGYQYRCVITDAAGNKIISDEAMLIVK